MPIWHASVSAELKREQAAVATTTSLQPTENALLREEVRRKGGSGTT